MKKIMLFLCILTLIASFPERIRSADAARSFSDVAAGSWYYGDVYKLAELGVVNGYGDGTFRPDGGVTRAEYIKMLLGVCGDAVERAQESDHWSEPYMEAAARRGILAPDGDILPDELISRFDMAKYTVLALGIEPARIDSPFTDSSDIYACTAFAEYLMNGYGGEDGCIFGGERGLTRAEASAVISRVSEYVKGRAEYRRKAILDRAEGSVLNTECELADYFCLMSRGSVESFELRSEWTSSELFALYKRLDDLHPESFTAGEINCNYTRKDGVYSYVMTTSYSGGADVHAELKKLAAGKAAEVAASIFKQDMTDEEKLKSAHDYLILNCQYDYLNLKNGDVPQESYMAYGALVKGYAVCQGYSSAFSLLCAEAGIRCAVLTGSAEGGDHAWNMALLDGEIKYIDVTFDDPVPDRAGKLRYDYYLIPADKLAEGGHVWDAEDVNIKYFYLGF